MRGYRTLSSVGPSRYKIGGMALHPHNLDLLSLNVTFLLENTTV
jgi:hypothetical protein